MAEDVRQVLARIVREYGTSITEDARRCESLLRDLCPESRREVFVLSSAIRERVPAELLGLHTSVPYPVLASRLAERLEHNLSLTAAAAEWAVDTWASGLGITLEAGGPYSAYFPAEGKSRDSFVEPSIDSRPGSTHALRTLVVSQDGHGQYSMIGAALADASPGDQIIVRRGTYREGLIVDRPVEIVGFGDPDEVIVLCGSGPCLTVNAEHAVVSKMTFHGAELDVGDKYAAVDIGRGEPVLENCNISCDSSDCVAIHGQHADPLLKRCRVHDGKGSGVHIFADGRGTLELCDIWGNAAAGVTIRGGSNPVVRGCTIHDSRVGIAICDSGRGTIEQCDIWGHEYDGITVSDGGDPIVRDCRVHDVKKAGVWVYRRGSGTFERCETSGNGMGGVEVEHGCHPIFRQCIHNDLRQS